MRNHITRLAMASMLASMLGVGAGAAIAGPEESDVAVRAEAVAPLAVGARVPSVTVQDIDGKPVALDEAIGSGAVALIFYRGGW